VRQDPLHKGRAELAAARHESRHLFWAAGIFGVFVNLLMLTGPLYMLQVYDRVLGSRSEETLIALSLLGAFLFAMMGILDFVRGRVLARVGARFQDKLVRDLEAVQGLLASPALLALFDMPWTPLFAAAIFIFHPWLGALAVAGGTVLVLLAVLNQRITRQPQLDASLNALKANRLSDDIMDETEIIQGLGMRKASFDRWQMVRRRALQGALAKSDRSGGVTATTKTMRLFLQSAMLGLGAYLGRSP